MLTHNLTCVHNHYMNTFPIHLVSIFSKLISSRSHIYTNELLYPGHGRYQIWQLDSTCSSPHKTKYLHLITSDAQRLVEGLLATFDQAPAGWCWACKDRAPCLKSPAISHRLV